MDKPQNRFATIVVSAGADAPVFFMFIYDKMPVSAGVPPMGRREQHLNMTDVAKMFRISRKEYMLKCK
jgi:hypothetical protein